MKIIKISLITLFLAFAMVNLSSAGKLSYKKVMNLTLSQAIEDPALATAMHTQLNDGFLSSNDPYYTVLVNYKNYVVRITGSYLEWKAFFQTHFTNADPEFLPWSPN